MQHELKTVSTSFVWQISGWRNVDFLLTLQSPKFSTIYNNVEIKVGFGFKRSVRGYSCFFIFPNWLPLGFWYRYKFSVIDEHNKKRFTQFSFMQNATEDPGVLWTAEQLEGIIRNEEDLTIHCTLDFQNYSETSDKVNSDVQTDDTTITEAVPYKNLTTLSSDFEKLYTDKANTDFVLKVDDLKFPVHRAVLSARSHVFSAMLQHEMLENSKGEADIHDIDGDTLGNLLTYVYCGKISLTPDTAASVFTAADKYAFLELREETLKFLIQNLTVSNICDACSVAYLHAEDTLENNVICFIQDNMQEVLGSKQWQEFSAEKPALVNKILASVCLAFKAK